jgi:fructose/tagatose bisphosphate aldolase
LVSLVHLRVLLDHAAEKDCGAAFNVNNMEPFQAIREAADETDSPVITIDHASSPQKADPRTGGW